MMKYGKIAQVSTEFLAPVILLLQLPKALGLLEWTTQNIVNSVFVSMLLPFLSSLLENVKKQQNDEEEPKPCFSFKHQFSPS